MHENIYFTRRTSKTKEKFNMKEKLRIGTAGKDYQVHADKQTAEMEMSLFGIMEPKAKDIKANSYFILTKDRTHNENKT